MTSREESPDQAPQQRVSRLGLYLPTSLLALVVVIWCGFWFYSANLAEQRLAALKAGEADRGRTWTCEDQRITGFPFRIELHCASLQLDTMQDGRPARMKMGAIHAATQIYAPTLVLADVDGPLAVESDGTIASAAWETMRVSVHFVSRLDRFSLVAANPKIDVETLAGDHIQSVAKSAEVHLRYDPERPADDHAVDVAIQIAEWNDAALNALLGSPENIDLGIAGVATQASNLPPRGWRNLLDDWRGAGGAFTIEDGKLAKGAMQIAATGSLNLDPEHRPQGKLDLSATGLGPLIARFGGGGGVNQLVGALFAKKDGAPVKWPLQLRDGRIQLGPLRTGAILKPLY